MREENMMFLFLWLCAEAR